MFSGQRKKPDSKKSGGQGQQPPTSLPIPPTHRGARATDRSPAIGWETQISDSNSLDSMYKYDRSIAQSLNTAQVAIAVPDFTHGIATRFVRYIGAIEVPGQMPDSVEVANTYMINLAWIGLYPPKFDGITDRAPPEFTQQVCFIDQAPHDPLNAPSQDTSIKMDMLEAIEPLFISGPSGLGKSHLMLGAAAQLAGRQNVVVIYIDDAGDLIFVSVVEHMACRFIDHQPWYKETEMAQTNLKRIRAYCDKKWITAIVDKPSNDVFMTVIAEATQQCVITTLPDFNDIDNIALARISKGLDNYPVDVVSTLTRVYADTEFHKVDKILERSTRISRLHSIFVEHDDALKKVRVGKNKELYSEMLRIKRAVFMMYHGLEMKPGSRRDLHFMVPDLGAIESRRYGMILYESYFRGTILEQFQWIFKLCASKYDMEPNERLGQRMTTVMFDFGRQVITLTDCITFDNAIEAASNIIADMRKAGPRYLPSKSKQTVTFGHTTMLHLPGLDFDEQATHHQGSFILALTREDKFTESVFTGCDIKVTWIVSDPIKVERDGRTTGVKGLPNPADAQAAEREREYNAPLRDMYDNDTEFGYENSWSAKAIKIFGRIGDKSRFAGADDVGMIAVNPESMSSFGFIAIETVNALKPTLKNV
ncbi:hypothetical protein DL89DRAFT_268829 [Linderina pennispora]|uniref:Uncharacterized protein n=1 Tax=Linderina pennispora TaxID=61395 RepID=A0A1Y1W459_9FUNG|nr:uncharacterized protein DL89DRAFT_268829 [Linderina pennispora]ORX68311.1 hypothetical protein DL89DRAFT_268829 [Linderina pennispora]